MNIGADEIRSLIGRGWDLPDGPAQIAAAEQAIRHADAIGDRGLAFAARMLATSAYHRGGEPAKSFVTFSWCLSDYDDDPAGHDLNDDRMLRWFFKYVVSSLPRFPQIPLERTHSVLEDMQRRYLAGGHSLHAVYNLRWLLARHTGDVQAADDWYARWCAAPRDENSDCAGCDPTEKVVHLRDRGQHAEAVALAEPVLAGELTCVEQPHSMLTELLMPYLHTGQLEQARDAHRRAYRARRGNVANMVDVAEHIEFCALTGNEARGLEIVQRHLEWLERPPSPYAAMEFASAAGLTLRRLVVSGHGDLTVHRSGADEVPVAELAEELAATAAGLADRFDARNGGTYQTRRIAERLAADPVVEYLPLSASLRRRTAGSAGLGDTAGTAGPGGTAGSAGPGGTAGSAGPGGTAGPEGGRGTSGPGGRGRPGAAPEVPADASAEELLDLAERYGRIDRAAAARAVLRVFDERYGGTDLDPLLVARRTDGRGNELAERRDVAGAEQAWREAADGYRLAGDELRAQVAQGRLGVLLCLDDRTEEGLPLVIASRDYVRVHGTAERRAGAHSRVGIALMAAGRPDEALPEFDCAGAAAAEVNDPYITADVALRRAHCLAAMYPGDDQAMDELDAAQAETAPADEVPADEVPADAADEDAADEDAADVDAADVDAARAGVMEFRAAARHARDLYRALGGDGLAVACLLYGTSFDPQVPDEGEQALEAFDESVRVASPGRASVEPHLARARLLCALGHADQALDDFVEVVALCTELDLPDAAAFTRFELTGAYRQAGRPLEAAEVGEEAVTALSALGELQAADRCRYLLAWTYRDLDEDDAALALLDDLAANLDGYDNLPARGQMLEEAGDLLYRQDRDVDAAGRFRAAVDAFTAAGLRLDALRACRRQAMALRWAGELDSAVTAVAEAEKIGSTLPAALAEQPQARWERAMLRYDATKILIAADRLGDALRRIAGVPRKLRDIDAFGEAYLAELLLGEVLLRMERPTEAEPVLRSVLNGLPRDAEPLPQAAWLLARSLSMQGRDEEAEAMRAEYGLGDADGHDAGDHDDEPD